MRQALKRHLRSAVALAIGALLLALSTARAREKEAAAPAGGAPEIRVSVDTRVPRELARLIRGKIIDDDSLDAWVALPGNSEILRVGRGRQVLDREGLRENLWHSILEHPARRGRGLGSLAFDPIDDLERMFVELEVRDRKIREQVAEHVAGYLPPGSGPLEVVVRTHLGGTWIARTSDAVYVNLSRFHDFPSPWFASLASVVAHEAIHLWERGGERLPRDAVTPGQVFGLALEELRSEGIARHVGFSLLGTDYPSASHAAWIRRRLGHGIAAFRASLEHLDTLRERCLGGGSIHECRQLVRQDRESGARLHGAGHAMARAIETTLGREALVSALGDEPARFFDLYLEAAGRNPDLPALGEDLRSGIRESLKATAGRRQIWRLRLEAREAHTGGDFGEAARILEKVLETEPRSPVDAYNLACALALKGLRDEAVNWLEEAVELGYDNLEHMERDADLDSLREGERYRLLRERLSGSGGSSPNTPRK